MGLIKNKNKSVYCTIFVGGNKFQVKGKGNFD